MKFFQLNFSGSKPLNFPANKKFKVSINFEDLNFIDGCAIYKKKKYTGVVYHSASSDDVLKLTYLNGLLVKSSRQGKHQFTNVYQYSDNHIVGILTYGENGRLLTVSEKNENGFVKTDNSGKLILQFDKLNDNLFKIIRQKKYTKIFEFSQGTLTRTITRFHNFKQPSVINLYHKGLLIQSFSGGNVNFYTNSKLSTSITKTIWSKEKNITDTTIKNFNTTTGKLVSITRKFNGNDLNGITLHKSETALYDQAELPFSYESELVTGQFIKTFISKKGKIVTQTIKNGEILHDEEGDFFRAYSLKTA